MMLIDLDNQYYLCQVSMGDHDSFLDITISRVLFGMY